MQTAFYLFELSVPPNDMTRSFLRGMACRRLLLLALACFFAISVGPDSAGSCYAQRGGPSPVVVQPVRKSVRESSQSFVGTVTPIRDSVVGSAVDGRVSHVFVEEGDAVSRDERNAKSKLADPRKKDSTAEPANESDRDLDKQNGGKDDGAPSKGQPLIQLRTGTLQIQIDTAQVQLENQRQILLEGQTSIPSEIEQLTASVAEIRASVEFAETDFGRIDDLFDQGGMPRKERDQAMATFESQRQRLRIAQTMLDRQQQTLQSRLTQAELQVKLQEEEVRRLEDLKTKYTIRAPFDGFVVQRMAEVGQWISQGEDVMRIIEVDPIEVTVNVPQTQIQNVQNGLDTAAAQDKPLLAQVRIESLPDLFEGRVVSIVPQADLRSRSFPVKIRLKNPQTKTGFLLKPGMIARVSLAIGDETEVLLVKKDALVLGGGKATVFVVAEDPQSKTTVARLVAVETGACIDDWIEVRGLLSETDRVVTEGNERLRPNQPIRIMK